MTLFFRAVKVRRLKCAVAAWIAALGVTVGWKPLCGLVWPRLCLTDLPSRVDFPFVNDAWGRKLCSLPGHLQRPSISTDVLFPGPDDWASLWSGAQTGTLPPTTGLRTWRIYSVGPNGLDEGSVGDDVLVSSLDDVPAWVSSCWFSALKTTLTIVATGILLGLLVGGLDARRDKNPQAS